MEKAQCKVVISGKDRPRLSSRKDLEPGAIALRRVPGPPFDDSRIDTDPMTIGSKALEPIDRILPSQVPGQMKNISVATFGEVRRSHPSTGNLIDRDRRDAVEVSLSRQHEHRRGALMHPLDDRNDPARLGEHNDTLNLAALEMDVGVSNELRTCPFLGGDDDVVAGLSCGRLNRHEGVDHAEMGVSG